jgi:hypothetical protein
VGFVRWFDVTFFGVVLGAEVFRLRDAEGLASGQGDPVLRFSFVC